MNAACQYLLLKVFSRKSIMYLCSHQKWQQLFCSLKKLVLASLFEQHTLWSTAVFFKRWIKKERFFSFKTRLERFLKIQAHIILITVLTKYSEVQSEGREVIERQRKWKKESGGSGKMEKKGKWKGKEICVNECVSGIN